MAEVRFTPSRILLLIAVVAFLAAMVIGAGWLAPENAKDAQQWYQALLAGGLAAGFGSFLV
jgi:hypothetical protein